MTVARVTLVALVVALGGGAARGEPGQPPARAGAATAADLARGTPDRLGAFRLRLAGLAPVVRQDRPVEPSHVVPTGAPTSEAESISITQKWWFWVGVGALLVTTTVLLLVATRDSEAPRTRLGNMEAFR